MCEDDTKLKQLLKLFVETEGYWEKDGFKKFNDWNLSEEDKKDIVDKLFNNSRVKGNNDNYKKIKTRYQNIIERWKPKECFGWKKTDFLEWWLKSLTGEGVHKCYYCGCTEIDYHKLYKKNNDAPKKKCMEKGKINKSKKNSFNSQYMEIDQEDPYKGYNSNNCVFACHLCNNAKSDLIQSEDFRNLIAPSIGEYIKELGKD